MTPANTLTLTCQKDRFNLPPDAHYLNCAYMAPLSKAVEAAGIEGIKRRRLPTQVTPESFFTESRQARELFARLVNAPDSSRVAIVPAVSYGVATVVKNLSFTKGQRVVIAHAQFPSNVYAWHKLQEKGVRVITVKPPAGNERRREAWNARILEAITHDTAVVALPNVHWADGTRFDLEAVGKRAREVGAALIVDGTQSVGALPFDLQRVQPDALLVAGYKWLMGPYSLGFAYYGPRFDGGSPLEETWIARKGSEDFSRLVDYQDDYAPGAVRFDMGERSNPILLPMAIAALTQLLEWGVQAIQDYCAALTKPPLEAALALGYSVEDERWRAHHLFGIRLPERVRLDTLKQSLAEKQIAVSVRGDAVRVSPHVYNDARDMEALVEALKEAVNA